MFGRSYTRRELEAQTGHIAQLCGYKRVRFADGLENGTEGIHIWNAAGLQLWVLPGRGMDIGMLHYKGIPLTWSSRTGYVHPSFLQQEGWPKGFHGGLLATCGLNNVGPGCRDGETTYEQHGSISRTPAADVACHGAWQGDDYFLTVQGTVHDADSKGRHLQLRRTIHLSGDGGSLVVMDKVTNLGIASEPCMIQYHMNFGFPLIGKEASLEVAGVRRVLDGEREAERQQWGSFPIHVKRPQVLYYDCDYEGLDEWGQAVIDSPGTGWQASIQYTHQTLPHLWRWNQFADGMHVCAIEPSNCRIKPRTRAKVQGELPLLEPGESRTFGIRFSVNQLAQGGVYL